MHEPCTCGCPHCSRCQFQAVLDEVEYHTEQRRAEQECPCSPPPCPSCAAKDAEIARLREYIALLKELTQGAGVADAVVDGIVDSGRRIREQDDIIARVKTYAAEHLMAEGGDRAAVGETIVRLIDAGPNKQPARAARGGDSWQRLTTTG